MSGASIVNNITLHINRYAPAPVLIFGFIGNTFNIVVFARPSLNKNPCSTYFTCLSIANLSVLFFGMLMRFLVDAFGIDLVAVNLGFCRFRYFILHSSMTLSSWYIILAGVDRYCISSRNVHHRQLSSQKHARYLVVLATFICLSLYSHSLVLFTIEQLKSGPFCYAQAGTYRVFYDFFYFATYSCIPPILMITVGIGTLHHIYRARLQAGPTTMNNANMNQLKKRDRQLIRMLLIQVIFTLALTLPLAIQKLYSTFTQGVVKDSYRVAIEVLIIQITRILAFTNSSTSFFV